MQVEKKKQGKNGMDYPKFLSSKPKIVIVSVVAVILVLNILWSLMQGKVSSESGNLQAELAKLEQRLVKVEEGTTPDMSALRAEFEAVRKVGEGYEARLAALLKAEEERLASMKKDFEAQEAWLESLKKVFSEGK